MMLKLVHHFLEQRHSKQAMLIVFPHQSVNHKKNKHKNANSIELGLIRDGGLVRTECHLGRSIHKKQSSDTFA